MDDQSPLHGLAGALTENARDLERELDWFARVLDARLKRYFSTSAEVSEPLAIAPPSLAESRSPFADFVRRTQLDTDTRLVLMLALIPHVRPQLLDVLWARNEATQRGFSEFGGVQGTNHGGFIPTGETAVFLLAGDELGARFRALRLFDGDHLLAKQRILELGATSGLESCLSGPLTLSRDLVERFTTGAARKPHFSSEFPARAVETDLSWEDLVLPAATLDQLQEIRHWIAHGATLLEDWGMRAKLRPGFTSLFHGPPGTGKTLSACLLGKHCGCDVYKIDLSLIISKYIGETEKNLAKIFDQAEHKGWILFFDEADALFGRRTRVDDSHDRYANQEISFLLQRIEAFNGVVILASNMKSNIDDAFLRRFHSVIYFAVPRPAERQRIWQNAFSAKAVLERRVDLARLAEKYEITGGTIMNVVRYGSLKALSRNACTVLLEDLEEGIRRELMKEGRTL